MVFASSFVQDNSLPDSECATKPVGIAPKSDGVLREKEAGRCNPLVAYTTSLLELLAGMREPHHGEVKMGPTAKLECFPKDNARFFDTDLNLTNWLGRFSQNQEENFVRSFLVRAGR